MYKIVKLNLQFEKRLVDFLRIEGFDIIFRYNRKHNTY